MKKKLVLKFPASIVNEPIVNKLIKNYNLTLNILKADIKPTSEGQLVLELVGEKADYDKALAYFKKLNITAEDLEKDIIRNEDACIHCTACVVHCPTKSLSVNDRKTMKVDFDSSKCIACEACIKVCAFKAMTIKI